jgi:transposase-like protein
MPERIFVKINGETHYLSRVVDHHGEVLETFVAKRRDRKAALKFLIKTMKHYGQPGIIVMDKLRSYGAAMKVVGNVEKQETGRWQNNRPREFTPPAWQYCVCKPREGAFSTKRKAGAALSPNAKFTRNSQPFILQSKT